MNKNKILLAGILIIFMIMPNVEAQNTHSIMIIALPIDDYSKTEIMDATIYGWIDCDYDQRIDVNELETFLERGNVPGYNSTNQYPERETISYLAFAPGYYPREGQLQMPSSDVYDYNSDAIGFYFQTHLTKKATNISVDCSLEKPFENNSIVGVRMVIGVESERSALGSYNYITDWATDQKYTSPAICLTIPYEYVNNVSLSDFDYRTNEFDSQTGTPLYTRYFYTFHSITKYHLQRDSTTATIQFDMFVKSPFTMHVTVTDMLMMDRNITVPIGILDLHELPFISFDGFLTEINPYAVCLDLVSDFVPRKFPGGINYGFIEYHPEDDPIVPVPGNMADSIGLGDPMFWVLSITIGVELFFGYLIVKFRKRDGQ